jgi:hypothetical protein
VGAALTLGGGGGVGEGSAKAEGPDAGGSFDYGLAEMLAGRYATGCPALESSFRLDPRPGTLFTLADCDRKWGKTASALAAFDEYLALYERMPPDQRAKQRERAAAAATERATLQRTVPLLSVRLPADAPAGARIWRDDVELTGPALAAAVPVDPGEHRVRVQLPDGRAREQRVSIEGGEQRTLVVDLPSEIAAPAPTPLQPAPAQAPPLVAATAPTSTTSQPGTSHAGWVYATGGIGVASLIVAGITGGVALGQKSIASPVCSGTGVCTTEQGVNAGNLARTMADVETAALIVGGVALVAAIVLWATEPRARRAGVVWTPSGVAAVW